MTGEYAVTSEISKKNFYISALHLFIDIKER